MTLASDFPRDDVEKRFGYLPPVTGQRQREHEAVREACKTLALFMRDSLPGGKESLVVQTKIEETMFWAHAALARTPE